MTVIGLIQRVKWIQVTLNLTCSETYSVTFQNSNGGMATPSKIEFAPPSRLGSNWHRTYVDSQV